MNNLGKTLRVRQGNRFPIFNGDGDIVAWNDPIKHARIVAQDEDRYLLRLENEEGVLEWSSRADRVDWMIEHQY